MNDTAALIRTLLLLQQHARNAAEFIAARESIGESIPNASALTAGVGPDGKPRPSQKDILIHNARQLDAMIQGHLNTLSQACQRFLGVTITDEPEEGEQADGKPAPRLVLAE